MINPNTAELNVDPDQFGNADFDSIVYRIDTLKYIPYGASEIMYHILPSAVSIVRPSGLASGAFFDARLQVTIPQNTYAGTYRGRIRVIGLAGGSVPGLPNTPIDEFVLEVNVGPIDDLDIDSIAVHGSANHGEVATTTIFRVYSTDAENNPDPDGPGNTTLYGVSFVASDLRAGSRVIPQENIQFVPSFFDSIRPGESKPIRVLVDVPLGTYATIYTGIGIATNNTGTTSDSVRIIINVNPSYDLDIADNEQNLSANKMRLAGAMGDSTDAGFFRLINPNSPALNVDPDPFGNADFTSLSYSVTDLQYVSVPGKINITIPSSAVRVSIPSSLNSGASYSGRVRVRIPSNTLAGVYRGTITVTGLPGEVSDNFNLEVVVGAVEDLDCSIQSTQSEPGHQGIYVMSSSFRVWSTDAEHNPDPYDGPGNTTLYGINFIPGDLRQGNYVIPANNINFIPAGIDSLYPGTYKDVSGMVYVPNGTFNGTYSGIVTVKNNSGSTSDTVSIFLTVLPSYDLDIHNNHSGLADNKMSLFQYPGNMISGSFLLVNPNSEAMNYDPDPIGNTHLTDLRYSVTDLVSIDGFVLSRNNVSFENAPSSLNWGSAANVSVNVSIPESQHYGTYQGIVTVSDTINEGLVISDFFYLIVNVGPQELFTIPDTIYAEGYAGEFANSVFYFKNIGNKTIERIEIFPMIDLTTKGGVRIPKDKIEFTPPILIDSIVVGESVPVNLRIEIPKGALPGVYISKAKAMQQRGQPAKNFVIKLTVKYRIDIDEGIVFSENPVNGPYVDIACLGTNRKITIMNMAAEIVRTAGEKDIRDDVFRWNLKNDKEKEVASGLYVVINECEVDGKKLVFTKKILVVK